MQTARVVDCICWAIFRMRQEDADALEKYGDKLVRYPLKVTQGWEIVLIDKPFSSGAEALLSMILMGGD